MKINLRTSMIASALAFSCVAYAQPASSFPSEMLAAAPKGKPWEPAWGFWPKATPESWQQTHWGFVREARKGGIDVLFIGDSITKGWAGAGKDIWEKNYRPLKSLNIGIGGDTTRQTLWRIEHEALAELNPRVVVLMIGVNNIFTGAGDDGEIAQGIGAVVKELRRRLARAKILLVGILPLGDPRQSERISRINRALADWQPESLHFLDPSSAFTGADGKVRPELYTADLVHLAPAGYEAWDKVMYPVLVDLLK